MKSYWKKAAIWKKGVMIFSLYVLFSVAVGIIGDQVLPEGQCAECDTTEVSQNANVKSASLDICINVIIWSSCGNERGCRWIWKRCRWIKDTPSY